MNSLKFKIKSDGDFYCTPLFTTIIHEDESVLHSKMIENLREINKTFNTVWEYLQCINDCLTGFLNAYDNPKVDSYFDEKYEDVWFIKENSSFTFSFSLNNGNQSIDIVEGLDIDVVKIDGGYEIKENYS